LRSRGQVCCRHACQTAKREENSRSTADTLTRVHFAHVTAEIPIGVRDFKAET
jgi:hypothetical protein